MAWKQAKERRKRLRKLHRETEHSYGCGAWYDEKNDRYYRYYVSDHGGARLLKRRATKKLRAMKHKDVQHNYGEYRKLYDFWWNLL